MSDAHHSIRAVAKRSGLSPHVIRVWEKRYGAVKPARTHTNRRLYSECEIERLLLLRHAVQLGHSIGNVARLDADALRGLVERSKSGEVNGTAAAARALAPESGVHFVEACMACTRALDAAALDSTLRRALVVLGHQGLLHRVIGPLAQALGDAWREGAITAAHEHFASAAIKVFLGGASRQFASPEASPVLVVATPAGQLHELGAVMAAAGAAHQGWRVTYLGVSLPAAEIAGAVLQNGARALALSLVYPEDDPHLEAELRALRQFLPPTLPVVVGGRAAGSYASTLQAVGAVCAPDLAGYYRFLDDLRAHKPAT
jgi:DNA-binding transcriptional MerR regulator/methylmalonyl-CoA mutase cobalamin-binding subunit